MARNRGNFHAPPSARPPRPVVKPDPLSQVIPPWKRWDSLAINLNDLPKEINAHILFHAFKEHGSIHSIDIFEEAHGNRESKGRIRFKPPPKNDFWKNRKYKISLQDDHTWTITVTLDSRSDSQVPSPTRRNVNYPIELKMPISGTDIGVLYDETTMLHMRTVNLSTQTPLVLDLKARALWIYFDLQLYYPVNPRNKEQSVLDTQHYRLKIPLVQLTRIFQTEDSESGETAHFIFLDSPPIYHRRLKNVNSTFMEDTNWRESDTWFRQTHIIHNPHKATSLPVGLKKTKPVVDIGRWNALRITYSKEVSNSNTFTSLCNILTDYNIKIEITDRFTLWDKDEPIPSAIWKWIDITDARPTWESSRTLVDLIDQNYIHLPFSARYQLEVCLSNGYLSEFSMGREFAVKLSELGESQAKKLLEHVATQKRVYYDPMKIFDLKFVRGVTNSKIPPYCCYIRSARITPSTIYYETPSMDMSNRIIRQYIQYADRFLRVRFTDEKLLGRIYSTTDNTMDEVFTRVKRALANGIVIGDRHYQFLAFGNSQFREHGAYFFAPLPNITAANIRAWMGRFDDIRNVAKHAARLGQCFSTTRAISGCPVDVRSIDDIVRNGYTFSDGVGRISKFLAQMVMSELKIKTPSGGPPSVFQFRLGGCKGILTVSPEAQRREVHIRKSQAKFTANHNGLEIIRWSQFTSASLNRQLIIVLSTLGIRDRIFHEKLRVVLRGLNDALKNDVKAIHLLRKYVDPNQMTLTISQMIIDGFRRVEEPFMTSVLTLWRSWHLKYLKDKAKITIDKGACLFGCMDETGILKGYFHDKIPNKDAPFEQKFSALPEIFLQIPNQEKGGKYEVVLGICILGRNPSLHSGDIRVVKAVDVPALHHLQDVVVLPQTGDRDIASMCSGGDLDGDDYVVIWDQDLIPKNWFREPMNYKSNKARDLDHDVTVDEITSFFVTYMKNDCLPTIAHAHLAWADRLENGVDEEKCIHLAQLHSDAVDYNKNGTPAVMARSLKPRSWPHFMEKKSENVYTSGKILGQLYDAVERVDFVPSLEKPFDKRILQSRIPVTEDLYQFARNMKEEYDTALRRIMAQHEIKTEFEVWSTFVLSHANMSKDYKFHEDIGMLSSSLREGFKKECYAKVGGRDFDRLAPLVLAMYRITYGEMKTALEERRAGFAEDVKSYNSTGPRVDQLPLISFPWIFPHVLGKITIGYSDYEEPEPVTVGEATEDAIPESSKNGHDTVKPNGHTSPVESAGIDPFGLFEGEEQVLQTPTVLKGLISKENESMESFNQLLDDFGLSESSISAMTCEKSPAVSGDRGMDLLDFDEPLQQEQVRPKQTLNEIANERKECKVEFEQNDVEPNALDRLYDLLDVDSISYSGISCSTNPQP
ncbi:RNA dependent RNA polymerase-domain-containing protein [Aspergillus ambiguus]|uniref:RNA dependent RNA polymerase n=1 Tax=Aspergillus ambiguus TaxID=176160 RepID=UPI003CCE2EFA